MAPPTATLSGIDALSQMLRPSGGGLYLVSTGRAEQLALQKRLYRASDEAEVQKRFVESLEKAATAKGILLGIPSDVGAGFVRGANLGPQAIRLRLLADYPHWTDELESLGIVDVGDVFVVPQLLHDDMLSDAQKAASRRGLYPKLSDEQRAQLPVSPLSITERALGILLEKNPSLKVFALGGDHSNSWPISLALSRVQKSPWGIVQPDAHTDLLEERLGVKYCFATWSYHANELLGRKGRLVQVGTRASGRSKEHWEKTYDVRQYWAKDVLADPQGEMDSLLNHVKSTGVKGVYFSNDIDGTDMSWADATGTPEPAGLDPEFVVELIRRLGKEVGLLGGDVMEVAPPVERTPESAERTLKLAARYLYETVTAALKG